MRVATAGRLGTPLGLDSLVEVKRGMDVAYDGEHVFVVDCHSDVMIDVAERRSRGERNVFSQIHLPRLQQGGVAAAVCTVGGDAGNLCPLGRDRPYESAVAVFDELERDVSESDGRIEIARSSDDLRELIDRGVFGIVPSLEGASALGDDLERLRLFVDRGLRCVGLTWNSRNALATGLGHDDDGLTPFGRAAVREMNRLGILIDLSHIGPVSFREVIRETEAPVIASHSNARAVHDHPRNLDDEQLDAIREVNGFVGVVFYPEFVGEAPVDVDNVIDHVDYLVDRIGLDSVGVGADFIDYALDQVIEELSKEEEVYAASNFRYPKGLEDCRKMGNFVSSLRRRGYTNSDVRKIAGENFIRLMREVEAHADR